MGYLSKAHFNIIRSLPHPVLYNTTYLKSSEVKSPLYDMKAYGEVDV